MSLVGSILSNLLLVMGFSFVAAGINVHESSFNRKGAGASITCLTLASLALALPSVFSHVPGSAPADTLMLSRIIAIVMGVVYLSFLFFSVRHSYTGLSEQRFCPRRRRKGISDAQL